MKATKVTLLLLVTLTITFSLCSAYVAAKSHKIHRIPTHFVSETKSNNNQFYNKYYSPRQQAAAGNTIPMFGGFVVVGYYYTNITVGTPGVNYNLIVDTGSSNIAMNSAFCSSCGTGASYDPTVSSTSASIPFNSDSCLYCSPPSYFGDPTKCAFEAPMSVNGTCGYAITYGGGGTALYGQLWNDTVCLGEYCVTNQPIGLNVAQYPSNIYTGYPLQGIFGMAYIMNSCNPTCVPVLYDTISQQNNMPNLFGMCLSAANGGEIDLGEIDTSKFNGNIQYTSIEQERWYNIFLQDIQIGGISINVSKTFYYTTNDVIGTFVDSGTSIILLNAFTFNAFKSTFETHYHSLPALHNLFSESCVLAKSIPDITAYPDISFVFNNEQSQAFSLPVPSSSYLIPLTIGSEQFYCLGVEAISSIGVVLGDVFMENYYVVFDKENSRLGFAPVIASACG